MCGKGIHPVDHVANGLLVHEEEISQAIDVLDAALADVAGGAVTDDQVAPYMMW